MGAPHFCLLCERAFGRNDKLYSHYRAFHRVDEQKMNMVRGWIDYSRTSALPGRFQHQRQGAASGQASSHNSILVDGSLEPPTNQHSSPSITAVSGVASTEISPFPHDDLDTQPASA